MRVEALVEGNLDIWFDSVERLKHDAIYKRGLDAPCKSSDTMKALCACPAFCASSYDDQIVPILGIPEVI